MNAITLALALAALLPDGCSFDARCTAMGGYVTVDGCSWEYPRFDDGGTSAIPAWTCERSCVVPEYP